MEYLKGFGLENFRVFKEHTWFDFAPITLLVGPNSSGKSSLTKGLWAFKNILKGDLSLKKDEDFLQLGNLERVFNNKSNSKILKFSEAVLLKNYPTFGENREVKLYNEYILTDTGTDITLFKRYLKLDDNLLYEIDYKNEKCKLNIQLFCKHLFVDDKKIKVQDGKIVDIEQPIEDLEYFATGKINFGKEIFSNSYDRKMDLEKILKIYSDKKECTDEFIEILLVETVTELKQYNDEEENSTYEDEYRQLQLLPLRALLLKAGYNNDQAKFITESIFDIIEFNKGYENYFEKNQTPFNIEVFNAITEIGKSQNEHIPEKITYENIRKIASKIRLEYHRGIKSNIQRIYRRIESDSFNGLLTIFFEKKIENIEKKFLEKASKIFNLQGEINPLFDKKYDTQTIEVSGLPLVEQGFGISQIVALLLKITTCKTDAITKIRGGTVAIICEEPEANLHPAFQSKLADMFVDAQNTFNHQFIIETHSEYMIRKFQYLVAKGKMKKEDIVIYYFNDPNNIPAGEKQVKKIEILEDGRLSSPFGTGFYDETAKIMSALLTGENLN